MRAGTLRNPGTLQQVVKTRDSMGGVVETWIDVATVRASKAHQNSREFYSAQKINAETTDLFIIRYRAGVNAKMRFIFNGKTYDIIGAPDPDGRRREIHISCKAVE